MANEERHCYVTEWYDGHAEIKRQYQLMHYLKDNTIEMYDIKNRRKFLNRTRLAQMPERLLIGTKLNIHARQHCIVDYGDHKTRQEHTGLNESTCGIITGQDNLGQLINMVVGSGLKITNLKSVRLTSEQVAQLGQNYAEVIGIEARGLDAVSTFSKISDNVALNCIAAKDADQAELFTSILFGSETKSTVTSSDGVSCAIIKPHALNHSGDIINDLLVKYGKLNAIKMMFLDRSEAEEFYEVYRNVVPEYTQMADELSSGPSIVLEIGTSDGSNIVESVRQFCGPTDPEVASAIRPHTLRARYGNTKVQNAIHCTDLAGDGAFESNFMFEVL